MRYYRNLVNRSVRKARNEYIKTQLDIYKNDAKEIWKHISDILPTIGNTQYFDNILDDENKQIPTEDLPEFINTYFATIGTKLDKQIPSKGGRNRFDCTIGYDITPLSKLQMITLEQLDIEISNISVYKSSGITCLSSHVLKLCFEILNEKLLVIMNNLCSQVTLNKNGE